jgi:choline transport protein
MLIVEGLMNMYIFWLIPWIELFVDILHIVLFIIFVVVLVALAPRHIADFVFFDRAAASGWDNYFVSWNLGLLTPTWGFVGEHRHPRVLRGQFVPSNWRRTDIH